MANTIRISFITTVLNEGKTIELLLNSLLEQTLLPHEVIIVDGGSRDNTFEKLRPYENEFNKKNIATIIKQKKGNRSTGRNEAIKNATGDVIVATDAGCILDKDWIKNITKPFEKQGVQVVSGYYLPKYNSVFEKSLATYTCVMPDRVDREHFLPSSRSIALRKSAWEKVKGYPEELDTCEDLVFDKKLEKEGYSFYFAQDAVVYWPQRKNIMDAFKQFYGYAKGDGKAHYFRLQMPLLFLRYGLAFILIFICIITRNVTLFLVLFILAFLYSIWAIKKNYRYVKNNKALYILPALQYTADFAVLLGTTVGFIESL